MFKQLEQRRAQVAFGEKKLAAVETRLTEIKQLADGFEKSIQAIAGREQVINAVKAEVEQVHQISARSRADLQHVAEKARRDQRPQGPRRRATVPHRRDGRADRVD
jgi:DNA repair ATPase RecN